MTSAWPRAGYALAGLAVAHVVLLLAADRQPGTLVLAATEVALALAFVLFGWLCATRRLPVWRREQLLAWLLLTAVAAAGLRAGATDQAWQLAELPILAVVAAAMISAPPWVYSVLAACPAAVAGAAATAAGRTGQPFGWQPWTQLALVGVTGAAAAAGLQRARACWVRALESAEQSAAEQSVRDPLTGSANRRGLEMVAAPMLEHARRDGQAVHCLVVDVDGLRRVNEQAGSRGGDEVLQCVAEALRGSSRTTDVVARWGEDQFVLIGPGTGTSPLEMERRIRGQVKSSAPVPEQVWNGRVSVGSATLVPWDDGDLGSLLGRAESDMALRRSLRRKAEAARQGSAAPAAGPVARAVENAGD